MMMLLRRLLWIPLMLVFGACGSAEDPEAAAPPVTVARVTIRDLTLEIDATGQLLAKDHAKIAAEVAGRITEVVIDEGLPVEPGGVVLEIDPERRELELKSAEARHNEARAALTEATREARRMRKLHEKRVASKANRDSAETALQQARSRADAAEARFGVAARALSDASVSAPFGGLVAERFVSTGEYVQPGQALFELVALDPIEVEFTLAERDVSRAALGQRVEVSVSPYPDEMFEGVVSFVSPTIDSRTRTLRVKATIDNADGRLRPGLFARAHLGVATLPDTVLVPAEAVLARSDGSILFLLEGDRVTRRVVETGRHFDGMISILSDLPEDTTIVTRGHDTLPDGVRVSIRNADGTEAVPKVAGGPSEAESGG